MRTWIPRLSHAAAARILLLLGLALTPSRAFTQEASVQGILLDQATSEPLPGATVVLDQGGRRVRSEVTDRNGLFQINGLDASSYRLRIMAFGYLTHEETFELRSGERRTVNRALERNPLQLQGLAVTARAPGAVRRELEAQTITPHELARVPTPSASGDLASYLQTQPGVVGSGDRGGQLFIRGGTPTQNLVLMDGMLVYEPFHITGFFSAFPEDLVRRAEFYAGGYGPRYSGRMSSVLDVQMRDGNRDHQRVSASVSPFLADVLAEGPIGRSGASESYIVSVRRSLMEETSPWLLGEKQPVGFDSEYLKLSTLSDDGGSRCALTLMRSRDEGDLDPEDSQSYVGWTNSLIGGRCNTLAGQTFVDLRFGWTGVSNEAITRGASRYTSSASRIFMDADVSRLVGPVRLNTGGYVHDVSTDFDLQDLLAAQETEDTNWGEAGVYAELEVPLGGGVRVLPGAAMSVAKGGHFVVEPRLRASWRPSSLDDAELSGAVGIYDQRLAGISDRRDASSVFVAWVRTPADSRMRALHAQGSWQQSLGAGFSYSVDGYYRRMYDLPVATWTPIASFTPDLSLADGYSYGGDARLEYRTGRFYGFAGYGYGWTEYESAQESFGVWFGEPVQSFHPPHDRRHQVNALTSLRLGRYTLAARWEYGSGFPFTRPFGFDELIDLRTDDTELPDVKDAFGQTRVLLDRPYNGRMPPTHHLDLSLRRPVEIGSVELQVQAGVINAYDQTNIFYYDVFTNRRIDQLPFAFYLSVKLQTRSTTPR